MLDGTRSTDPDGDKLTLAWSFVSVPIDSTATLSDPTHMKPTFTADLAGDYVIQLVVNDGTNSSAPETNSATAPSRVTQSQPNASIGRLAGNGRARSNPRQPRSPESDHRARLRIADG